MMKMKLCFKVVDNFTFKNKVKGSYSKLSTVCVVIIKLKLIKKI